MPGPVYASRRAARPAYRPSGPCQHAPTSTQRPSIGRLSSSSPDTGPYLSPGAEDYNQVSLTETPSLISRVPRSHFSTSGRGKRQGTTPHSFEARNRQPFATGVGVQLLTPQLQPSFIIALRAPAWVDDHCARLLRP